MARSSRIMLPGLAFCVAGLVTQGLTLYVTGAIGVALIVIGGTFWIIDGE